jgi:hypothetical protein
LTVTTQADARGAETVASAATDAADVVAVRATTAVLRSETPLTDGALVVAVRATVDGLKVMLPPAEIVGPSTETVAVTVGALTTAVPVVTGALVVAVADPWVGLGVALAPAVGARTLAVLLTVATAAIA